MRGRAFTFFVAALDFPITPPSTGENASREAILTLNPNGHLNYRLKNREGLSPEIIPSWLHVVECAGAAHHPPFIAREPKNHAA
jgi:hypothetical protein